MVLPEISHTLGLLEFLIRNPDDWFTVRDLYISNKMDINCAYRQTKLLQEHGFIVRERRKGFGRSVWVKLDKSAKQTEIIMALYVTLKR